MKGTAMRRFAIFLVYISILLPTGCDNSFSNRPLPPIEVHFSPQGGCTDAVVREIDAAQSSILIQAYSFTSTPIAKAVVEACNRGVHVEVILDRSQKTEKYSEADFLHNARVPVLIDSKHAIAHNKIMIIDFQTVITGSFNFTKSAEEHNAENLLVIRDKILADQYTLNWKLHADHSEEYEGRNGE
jgi:phosphatidylserine/phosphatidylglycerophosphate/cardiolipin synthase-like enzyme